MYDLEDLSPTDSDDLDVDYDSLRESLTAGQYSEVLDTDGEVDKYEVLCEYGVRFLKNNVWVRVVSAGIVKLEVRAHDVLSSCLYYPGSYEGMSSLIVSDFIGLFLSVAQGQGGGFAIINIENGCWIFKTNEFSVQHILWIPNRSLFVCLHDVATYVGGSVDIILIKCSGESAYIHLATTDHFDEKHQHAPCELPVFNIEPDAEESLDTGNGMNRGALVYRSGDDSLYIYGRWMCSCKEIIDVAEFKKS